MTGRRGDAILEVETARGEGAYDEHTTCVAVARIGQDDEKIARARSRGRVNMANRPFLVCRRRHGRRRPQLRSHRRY